MLDDERQVLAAGHFGARLGVDHRRRGQGAHERRRRRHDVAGAPWNRSRSRRFRRVRRRLVGFVRLGVRLLVFALLLRRGRRRYVHVRVSLRPPNPPRVGPDPGAVANVSLRDVPVRAQNLRAAVAGVPHGGTVGENRARSLDVGVHVDRARERRRARARGGGDRPERVDARLHHHAFGGRRDAQTGVARVLHVHGFFLRRLRLRIRIFLLRRGLFRNPLRGRVRRGALALAVRLALRARRRRRRRVRGRPADDDGGARLVRQRRDEATLAVAVGGASASPQPQPHAGDDDVDASVRARHHRRAVRGRVQTTRPARARDGRLRLDGIRDRRHGHDFRAAASPRAVGVHHPTPTVLVRFRRVSFRPFGRRLLPITALLSVLYRVPALVFRPVPRPSRSLLLLGGAARRLSLPPRLGVARLARRARGGIQRGQVGSLRLQAPRLIVGGALRAFGVARVASRARLEKRGVRRGVDAEKFAPRRGSIDSIRRLVHALLVRRGVARHQQRVLRGVVGAGDGERACARDARTDRRRVRLARERFPVSPLEHFIEKIVAASLGQRAVRNLEHQLASLRRRDGRFRVRRGDERRGRRTQERGERGFARAARVVVHLGRGRHARAAHAGRVRERRHLRLDEIRVEFHHRSHRRARRERRRERAGRARRAQRAGGISRVQERHASAVQRVGFVQRVRNVSVREQGVPLANQKSRRRRRRAAERGRRAPRGSEPEPARAARRERRAEGAPREGRDVLEFERLERGGDRDARSFRRGDVRGSLDVLRVARGRARLPDHRVQDNRAREPLVGNTGEHLRVRAVLDEIHRRLFAAERRFRRLLFRLRVRLRGDLRLRGSLRGVLGVRFLGARPRLLRLRARQRVRDRRRVVARHAHDVGFGSPARVLVRGERDDAALRRRRRRQRGRVEVLSPWKVQRHNRHETRRRVKLEGITHRPLVRIHQRRAHRRNRIVLLLGGGFGSVGFDGTDVFVAPRKLRARSREVHQALHREARRREVREPAHCVLGRRLGAVHPGKEIITQHVHLGGLRRRSARARRRGDGASRRRRRVLGEVQLLLGIRHDVRVRSRARPVVLLVLPVPRVHQRFVFAGLRLERLARRRRLLLRRRRRRRRRVVRRLRRLKRQSAARGDRFAIRRRVGLGERGEQTRDQRRSDKELALVGVLGRRVRLRRGGDRGVGVEQSRALGRGGGGFLQIVVRQVREQQRASVGGDGLGALRGGLGQTDERRGHRRRVHAGRAGLERHRDGAPIDVERGRGRGAIVGILERWGWARAGGRSERILRDARR